MDEVRKLSWTLVMAISYSRLHKVEHKLQIMNTSETGTNIVSISATSQPTWAHAWSLFLAIIFSSFLIWEINLVKTSFTPSSTCLATFNPKQQTIQGTFPLLRSRATPQPNPLMQFTIPLPKLHRTRLHSINVISRVCSNWALRFPSLVVTTQSSGHSSALTNHWFNRWGMSRCHFPRRFIVAIMQYVGIGLCWIPVRLHNLR